ncbi:MAG: acyl carrier protein [Gammaproteobacteria bacterium]
MQRLCAHLQRMAGSDTEIGPDDNLIDQLALDSMKVMNLIMELEDEFDISVPINALADVNTVADLAKLIESLNPVL